MLDWLDKILPRGYVQTTTSLTDSVRNSYVEAYKERAEEEMTYRVNFPGPASLQKLVKAVDTNIISPEQARRELGIDDPYVEWATRSEHQWRERAKAMQTKGKCLWCTTPYEDESVSCTKCGAPKEVNEIEVVIPMMTST